MNCKEKCHFVMRYREGVYHRSICRTNAALISLAALLLIALAPEQSGFALQDQSNVSPQTAPPKASSTMPLTTSPQISSAPSASKPDAQAQHTNHLIHETSPYLLQHARNPVNWYPWGTEAFEAARAQDKPIFLSIGYSTCYWCHVMERESFEDEATAAIMNEHFVCIKVDREERPDVDDIYMAAVQKMTGSGGWPMSVFLEPQSLKPFDAGTYFPPQDMQQLPSFSKVLQHAADAWQNQREKVLYQAKQAAIVVQQQLSESAQPVPVGKDDVEKAVTQLLTSYDRQDGGFNTPPQRAPKFPSPANIDFILNAAWDNKPAQKAALFTLDRMAIGGMYDQVGGGFHRYSTDDKWLVPHFEKMLYDNGQLASTYARAFELTKDPYYAQVVRQTLDYVLREMTDGAGAFYSAQDAEVNAHEGENYLWVENEVRETLANAGFKDDIDLALSVYGLKDGPNFQDPHHPELGRKNVLFLTDKPTTIAKRMSISIDDFNARIERVNRALLAARNQRPQPGKDDKILAAWNGLMIAGMADGGRVLNEKKYKDAAEKAAQFIMQKMRDKDGGLLRSYRSGQAKIPAFLEDYAMMIHGLIAVNRATGNPRMLEDAKSLARNTKSRFWDASAGGYFDTLDGQSDLFVRVKSSYDGAIPSGNSMMLMNLLDLQEATGMIAYLDDATAALKGLSSVISKHPSASILATQALNRFVKNYPQRLDQSKAVAAKSSADATSKEPVVVSVDPIEVNVKPGVPATFIITMRINSAFHITAHQPGDDYLIPLNIKLTGCEGLKLSIEYPRGEEFKGSDSTTFVYKGVFTLPVKIEQTGSFSGQPRLTLTYQACTNKECLVPKTEPLGVRIIAQR